MKQLTAALLGLLATFLGGNVDLCPDSRSGSSSVSPTLKLLRVGNLVALLQDNLKGLVHISGIQSRSLDEEEPMLL